MFKKTFFLVVKINKKIIVAIFILLLFLTLATVLISNKTISVFNNSSDIIVVDPGHGGIDGGSSSNGLLEKDVNLQIGLKLSNALRDMGINVVMTRDSDVSLESKSNLNSSRYNRDLHARKIIIDKNNAKAFVSIHMDAFNDPSARGISVFYYSTSEESKKLATEICNNINETVIKGFLKTDDVKARVSTGDYYLLRRSESPGVIIETGFITNPTDNKLIQTEEYQNIMSKAIAEGLVDYILN